MREEKLVRQFGAILQQIRIPTELAGKLATVLRESQADKEKFVRTSMLRLQQQQMLPRSKWIASTRIRRRQHFRRALDDKISGAAAATAPSPERDGASGGRQRGLRGRGTPDSRTRANRLLLVCCEKPDEQARVIKTLVPNATFDRGSLSPTYVKPFDVFAKGSETCPS